MFDVKPAHCYWCHKHEPAVDMLDIEGQQEGFCSDKCLNSYIRFAEKRELIQAIEVHQAFHQYRRAIAKVAP